jgi:hypothetical protein
MLQAKHKEVSMFGLWFAIAGMITGIVCSYIAKKKNRTQKTWYMLGQICPIISIIIISLLDSLGSTPEIEENNYSPSPMN